MNVQTVITADGSVTFYVPELDETYHSIHGAIQESIHVFINEGLKFKTGEANHLRILEMGFGTGLNALLTAAEAQRGRLKIDYHSIEKYPLETDQFKEINYSSILKSKELYEKILLSEWNKEIPLSEFFTLNKIHDSIDTFMPPANFYDLIYFDAFGPRVQPEMWEVSIFAKMFSALKMNGALVTYCAKGQVRRNMKEAGFIVEKLKGPPGKREMTRAIRQAV